MIHRPPLIGGLAIALLSLLLGCSSEAEQSMQFILDDNGTSPTAAVDESGTVYWSWFGSDDAGAAAVYAARLESSATTPGPAGKVNSGSDNINPHPQAPPQIAVGSDGTVYVAWSTQRAVEGRRFPASDIVLARSPDGGRTFEQVYVNEDAGGSPAGHTFHDLAVGPEGNVYVSWLDSRGPDTAVRIARSADGGRTFRPSTIVAEGTCQCCRTALFVTENADVFVAWRHIIDGNIRDITLARSSDGGTSFSSPVRVHADGWAIDGCPHSGPALVADGRGRLHVAWYTAADGRVGLYHTVSSDEGRTFGAPRPLETNVPISSARLTSAGAGAYLAWENPTKGLVYAGSAEENIPEWTIEGSSPALAAAASRWTIAWERDGGIRALVSPGSGGNPFRGGRVNVSAFRRWK